MKNTHSAPATSGRLRRLVTRTLLALALTGGVIIATPRPAEAASYVRACFRGMNGEFLAGATTYLQIWVPDYGPWTFPLPQALAENSCSGFYIPAELQGYHFRVVLDYRAYGGWWRGESLWVPPGDLPWYLPPQRVMCYGCSY